GGTASETGPFIGTWTGYVENYSFFDGSSTLAITIDAVTATVAGHITFGSGPPLAPPTDPNVGYPPGIDFENSSLWSVYPGYSYALIAGSFDGQHLKFQVDHRELWKQWCELQTSYADQMNAGNWNCLPNWGFTDTGSQCYQQNPATNEAVYVDC